MKKIFIDLPIFISSIFGFGQREIFELAERNPIISNIIEYFVSFIIWVLVLSAIRIYLLIKNKNPEFINLGLCVKREVISKSKTGEKMTTSKIIPYPSKYKDGVLWIQNLGHTTKEDIEKILPSLSSHYSRIKNKKVDFSVIEIVHKTKFLFINQTWFKIFEPKHPEILAYNHAENVKGKFYLGQDQFQKPVFTKDHRSSHCLMFLGIGGSGKSEAAKNCIEDYKSNFPKAKVYIVSAKPPVEDYWYMLSHPDVKFFNPTDDLDKIIELLERMFTEWKDRNVSDDFKEAIWLFDECGQYLVKKKGEEKELATKRAKFCQLVQSHAQLNRYTGIPMILCNQNQNADALEVDKGLIHYIFTGRTSTPQMSQQLLGSQIAFHPKFHQGLLAGRDDDGNVLEVKFRYLNDLSKSVLFTRPQGFVLDEIMKSKGIEKSSYDKALKYFPDLEVKEEKKKEEVIEEEEEESLVTTSYDDYFKTNPEEILRFFLITGEVIFYRKKDHSALQSFNKELTEIFRASDKDVSWKDSPSYSTIREAIEIWEDNPTQTSQEPVGEKQIPVAIRGEAVPVLEEKKEIRVIEEKKEEEFQILSIKDPSKTKYIKTHQVVDVLVLESGQIHEILILRGTNVEDEIKKKLAKLARKEKNI